MTGSAPSSPAQPQEGAWRGIDYRLMLEAFAEAVVVCDPTHRIVYINPAAERLLLWPAGELVGQPVTTIIPERLQPLHREGYKRYLATHKPRLIGRMVRVPALRKDGAEIEIELGLNAMTVGGEELIIAALRDVEERIQLERQLTVTRYLRATTAAAARLSMQLEVDQMLETIVQTLVSEFDSALARIWLYDPAENLLTLRASAGLSTETERSSRARIHVGSYPYKVAEVARTQRPLIRNGLRDDPQFDQEWVTSEQIAAAAIFPLLGGGELRGVLAHFSRKLLPDEVAEALAAFAAIVSSALNDVQLFAREQAARVEAQDERQKLQTILDMLPVGVLLAEGTEGRVTIVNQVGQRIRGEAIANCTIEEFDRQFPLYTMEGTRLAPERVPLARALQGGERVRETLRYRRPDGLEGVLEVTAAPFPGPRGGAVASFRDVTAQLRMESELAERAGQLKALLEYLPVGVAYFDELGICRAANRPAARFLGRSRSEITGVPARELFLQAPELLAAVERCIREQAPHAEQSTPWADGDGPAGVRFIDWRFEPLPPSPPRPAGALALLVDVTERKRAEDDLKVAKEAAEQTARNKTRFLSAVSHDLRTPVNALSLLAELLGHIVNQQRDPGGELRAVANDLRLASANLIELINDLLDLARFDSGDVAQHPTDFVLDEWLAATIEPLQLTARAKNLELSWEVDRPGRVLHADRVKLSRVLTNLVGNAVKFTEAGSVVVKAGAVQEGWFSLTVTDTGPGIPADQLERIFDEFAQLRNPERDRTKGTGLGLAICKRLVEAVGGRLTVQSRVGVGSTFTALYPPDHLQRDGSAPAPESRDQAAPPEPAAGPTQRAPILLVEDDARSRQALSRLLTRVGYRIEPAANGPEALEVLDRFRPALILLDLMMPGMDGGEVLRRIRQRPDLAEVPVILLSGDVLGGRHNELMHLGVSETLAKPVDFDALVGVIQRNLQN